MKPKRKPKKPEHGAEMERWLRKVNRKPEPESVVWCIEEQAADGRWWVCSSYAWKSRTEAGASKDSWDNADSTIKHRVAAYVRRVRG